MAQGELNGCAGQDFREANAELNRVYSALLLQLQDDPVATEALKKSERAWIAFRDSQINALHPHPEREGSVSPMCWSSQAAALTTERMKMLKEMLHPQEGDVCSYWKQDSAGIDKRVAALIEQMTNRSTEEKAFSDLEALGCAAVPATIRLMDDRRNLPDPRISLMNKSADAFEGRRHYGPQKVVDALAAILSQVTGEHFGFIYNGATDEQRSKAVQGWREFLRTRPPGKLCSSDTFIGAWKLNLEKSSAVPQDRMISIESRGSSYRISWEEWHSDVATGLRYWTITDMNGVPTDLMQADGPHTHLNENWRVTRESASTFVVEWSPRGYVFRFTVSPDGQTLTQQEVGKNNSRAVVFDRVH